jgi:TAG lipase/steryl ester hydrolase/phospholipase A2/LPA acyltransferase
MSLLTDTVFSGGSTRLHTREDQYGCRSIRKSKSHGGLLSPLIRMARDPLGTLNNVVGTQPNVPQTDTLGVDADRRQILYLRMKNVGT